MKINKKLIGISVASLGVLFSIGGAFALYQQAATDASFGISQGEYEGSVGEVTYKINGSTSGTIAPAYLKHDGTNGGTGLGGLYDQVLYDMPLSATFANTLNAQDYVVGNISVSITNIPEAYRGKLAIWVDIDGYEDDSLGADTYGHAFMNSDYAITNENTSYSGTADVAVSSAGTQHLRIFLKYDLEGVNLLNKDEAGLGYTLSVTWGEPSNSFIPAYVLGNANQWTPDGNFAMAPNINKASDEGFEWIYNNLPGTIGEAKCFKADVWSAGDNAALDAEKSYTVYWNGSNESVATFTPIV